MGAAPSNSDIARSAYLNPQPVVTSTTNNVSQPPAWTPPVQPLPVVTPPPAQSSSILSSAPSGCPVCQVCQQSAQYSPNAPGIECSNENGYCKASRDGINMAYGAEGKWVMKQSQTGIAGTGGHCNKDFFGVDPAPGIAKKCFKAEPFGNLKKPCNNTILIILILIIIYLLYTYNKTH